MLCKICLTAIKYFGNATHFQNLDSHSDPKLTSATIKNSANPANQTRIEEMGSILLSQLCYDLQNEEDTFKILHYL